MGAWWNYQLSDNLELQRISHIPIVAILNQPGLTIYPSSRPNSDVLPWRVAVEHKTILGSCTRSVQSVRECALYCAIRLDWIRYMPPFNVLKTHFTCFKIECFRWTLYEKIWNLTLLRRKIVLKSSTYL